MILEIIHPLLYPSCSLKGLYQDFFEKHCVISKHLATKPKDYIFIVNDGDVVGNPRYDIATLTPWLNMIKETDLLILTREWNYEITGGLYICKHTNYAKNFY